MKAVDYSYIGLEHRECFQYPASKNYFRPSVSYPEYIFGDDISDEKNDVYDMVRNALALAGFDKENFGSPNWNPLGHLIKPGYYVLIKPNMVMEKNLIDDDIEYLYTQPSVIAAVIDYVVIAMKGANGKIVIGDAPMQECNFQKLVEQSGFDMLINYYKNKGIDIDLVDFRELSSVIVGGIHRNMVNEEAYGRIIDLKNDSEFSHSTQKEFNNMRITNYDPRILLTHHQIGKNEYYISDYILNADVVINMPKPKTHRKAGITCSLKNLIGINVRKEYLPHHTMGAKDDGIGDEYKGHSALKHVYAKAWDIMNIYAVEKKYGRAKLMRYIWFIIRQLVFFTNSEKYLEGSWYGNDTISKTIVDLNMIALYADKTGTMQESRQRNYLIVADMIKAGEKEGPIMPSLKEAGIIAVGQDPVCFDECVATIMGADIEKIPTIKRAREHQGKYEIVKMGQYGKIASNDPKWNGKTVKDISPEETLLFRPSEGWAPAFYNKG